MQVPFGNCGCQLLLQSPPHITPCLLPACVRTDLCLIVGRNCPQAANGIAGVIRFINGSKGRMTQLKQELAACTNRLRQGYEDETIFLSMVLEGGGCKDDDIYIYVYVVRIHSSRLLALLHSLIGQLVSCLVGSLHHFVISSPETKLFRGLFMGDQ